LWTRQTERVFGNKLEIIIKHDLFGHAFFNGTDVIAHSGFQAAVSEVKPENVVVESVAETDPMIIIDCEYAPEIHYWYYWEKGYDYNKHTWQETKNTKQGNYYVSCGSSGTAHMINAYVFKDYKLFFKLENIYRGRFFADREDNFYVIDGIINLEANAYPFGYRLTKHEYDRSKDELVEMATKEFRSKPEIEALYRFEKENNVYFNDSFGEEFYNNAKNNLATDQRF
jgi:hypothetical protein